MILTEGHEAHEGFGTGLEHKKQVLSYYQPDESGYYECGLQQPQSLPQNPFCRQRRRE